MDTNIPYGRMGNGEQIAVTQPQVQQAQPTMVMSSPGQASQPRMGNFNSRAAVGLGIVQIVCGALSFCISIGLIVAGSNLSPVSEGIWCGIIIILAGSFQIVSGKTKTRCWIITSLVFSILAAVFTIPILITGTSDIVSEVDNENMYNYYNGPAIHWVDYYYRQENWDLYYGLRGFHLFIAVVEGVVAIVSSTLGCKPICCNNSQIPTGAHQVQYMTAGQTGQQVIMLTPMPMNQQYQPNQQVMVASMQPGFTAPVLSHTGAPPVYTTVPAAVAPVPQAAPVFTAQLTTEEQKAVSQ